MTISKTTTINWRKSSHSGNGGGQCVEIATDGAFFLARDSKHPNGATLAFTREGWVTFLRDIKSH